MSKHHARHRAPPFSHAAPRASRTIAHWLAVSFVLLMGTLLVLNAAKVRLGQGYFEYRYSPVKEMRTVRALPCLLIAALVLGSIHLLSRGKRIGRLPLVLSLAGATLWVFTAPPSPTQQHAFNLRSMSSDGDFVTEAESFSSLSAYLRNFQQRLQRTPAEMGGTRVLSNPPGTTAAIHLLLRAYPPQDRPPRGLDKLLTDRFEVDADNVSIVSNSLKAAGALCLAWACAAFVAFFLGRIFLSRAGALVFAVICCFNPCTVHFVPGKDPAQLLTINVMLLAWFAAWKLQRPLIAPLAGAALVIGATVGLVHIWVALAVLAATTWQAVHQRNVRPLLFNVIAAALGALATVATVFFTIDWNIPAQLLAVSRRFAQLQQTFNMSRPTWFIIGLPIFLLFLSPGFWTLAGLRAHRRPFGFGARLALCTGAVMLFTYLLGVTYELPRLWVAFLPPLTLGLAIDLPLLRGPGFHRPVARALMLILAVQVVYTAMHWTIFDVRESEYRLLTRRFYQ